MTRCACARGISLLRWVAQLVGGAGRLRRVAVLNGTLLGSLPAQAEPETAAGLTHEHVVSYGG